MEFFLNVNIDYTKHPEESEQKRLKALDYFETDNENDWFSKVCKTFENSSIVKESSTTQGPFDIGSFAAGDGVGYSCYYVTKNYNDIWIDYDPYGALPFAECSCRFYDLSLFFEEIKTAVSEYYGFDFPYCNLSLEQNERSGEYYLRFAFWEEESFTERMTGELIKENEKYFIADDKTLYKCEAKMLVKSDPNGKYPYSWEASNLNTNEVLGLKSISEEDAKKNNF